VVKADSATEPNRSFPPGWRLKARILSVLTAPDRVRFEQPVLPGQTPPVATVNIRLLKPGSVLRLAPGNAVCKSAELACPNGDHNQYELRALPREDLPPGWFETVLELEVLDEAGNVGISRRLSVDGFVDDVIRVFPNPIQLGVVDQATPTDTTLVLTGREPTTRFEITGVVLPDGASLTPLEIDEYTARYRLRYQPGRKGHIRESLIVAVRLADATTTVVPVDLFAYGVR
jgi:hypothetical protein